MSFLLNVSSHQDIFSSRMLVRVHSRSIKRKNNQHMWFVIALGLAGGHFMSIIMLYTHLWLCTNSTAARVLLWAKQYSFLYVQSEEFYTLDKFINVWGHSREAEKKFLAETEDMKQTMSPVEVTFKRKDNASAGYWQHLFTQKEHTELCRKSNLLASLGATTTRHTAHAGWRHDVHSLKEWVNSVSVLGVTPSHLHYLIIWNTNHWLCLLSTAQYIDSSLHLQSRLWIARHLLYRSVRVVVML